MFQNLNLETQILAYEYKKVTLKSSKPSKQVKKQRKIVQFHHTVIYWQKIQFKWKEYLILSVLPDPKENILHKLMGYIGQFLCQNKYVYITWNSYSNSLQNVSKILPRGDGVIRDAGWN